MITYQIITLFAILLRFGDIDANKFNISFSHLDNCKEYTIISEGYNYKNFFQINSMNNPKFEDNQKLHLKFFVMAPRDAYILLTEFENLERFYEINFGGYDNSRSLMYENGKVLDEQKTPNLLSTFDPMPIEIIQTNGGQLIVNIPGFAEPYLNYTDSNPLNIRLISFSSWKKSPAKWYYDCSYLEELTKIENQQHLSEEQITSKLSATDLCVINKLKEYFCSKTRPFSKYNSFFDVLAPILDNFDDNKMFDFQLRVFEVIKELKNTPTTTTKKPVAIDVRIGDSEKSSCSCS